MDSVCSYSCAGRRTLQTLFSTYPRGGPGWGLLLLRAAIGATAIAEGVIYFSTLSSLSGSSSGQLALSFLLVLSGAALVLGCMTPVAGFVSAVCFGAMFFEVLPQRVGSLVYGKPAIARIILISVSIILLGPGGFSVDAYWFGRREIVIPPPSRTPGE